MKPADAAIPPALWREAQQWVVRLASGQVTAGEGQAFSRWCRQSRLHATAFAQARSVWRELEPAARRVAHRETLAPAGRGRPALARRAFLGTAAAPGAVYLAQRPPLGLWPGLAEMGADFHTATGEQREIQLAGDVQVLMNTQTRLSAPAPGALTLHSGEAEFALGSRPPGAAPLRVRAGQGTVVARAGRFNVRSLGDRLCVTCMRGEVEVEYGARTVSLGADQQLALGPGERGQVEPASPAALAWQRRLLVFNKVPLSEVVDEVNRYRRGRLVLMGDALGRNLVQASFPLERLDDVVALIRDAYGASVTHLPGGVVVLRPA